MSICPVCGSELDDENRCNYCGVIFSLSTETEIKKIEQLEKKSRIARVWYNYSRSGMFARTGIFLLAAGFILLIYYTTKFILENPDLILPP